MEKLIVDNKYNKKRLDKFILKNLPNMSIDSFYKLLRKKDIKINGKRVNTNVYVNENDEVIVYAPVNLSNRDVELNIVYEDDNILIINKQHNIEVTGKNSLTDVVQRRYIDAEFKPMPCHRLDRNTTG